MLSLRKSPVCQTKREGLRSEPEPKPEPGPDIVVVVVVLRCLWTCILGLVNLIVLKLLCLERPLSENCLEMWGVRYG